MPNSSINKAYSKTYPLNTIPLPRGNPLQLLQIALLGFTSTFLNNAHIRLDHKKWSFSG